jgi:tol-pal system protein YbgF
LDAAIRECPRTRTIIRLVADMTRFSIAAFAALTASLALAPLPASAQMSESDLVMRLNRLEAQVRQLTGTVEQLQFRNQQLEQQLRSAQQETEPRPNNGARPGAIQSRPTAATPQGAPVVPQAVPPMAPQPTPGAIPRRSDVFDPNEHPQAPGAPRTLGSLPPVAPPPGAAVDDEPPVGAPHGRQAGAPLDLSTLSSQVAEDPAQPGPVAAREIRTIPGVLPAPPPRNPNATGPQMVMAPSNTPKDEYDLAYGYVLRKDYALAEDALRAFLKKYPSDRLVADANYWLGESLFQRQRYREAAESFLTVSTKFESSGKAPDSLLRLAQSLAALKEKEAACATLGEIPRKYPRASGNVKGAVEREQKRIGC